MKTSLKFNLLQHLRRKQAEGGFTLIELLVVIIIIGILAAIALPSFLNQANRARETEASNAIGALNRGQQAYYLEKVEYAGAVGDLDVGVAANSENYAYGTGASVDPATADGDGKFTLATDKQTATIYASPKTGIRGFAGVAYVTSTGGKNATGAILCRETAANAKTAGVTGTAAASGCTGGLEGVK